MDEIIELKDIPPEYRDYLKKVAEGLKRASANGNQTNGAGQRDISTPFATYDSDVIGGEFKREMAYD